VTRSIHDKKYRSTDQKPRIIGNKKVQQNDPKQKSELMTFIQFTTVNVFEKQGVLSAHVGMNTPTVHPY